MNFTYTLRVFLITLYPGIRNMNKRPLLLILSLFLVIQLNAQFDSSFIKTNIRRCADSLVHSFKTRNWDQFARYSYPAMVASLGGVKEFKDYISNIFSQIPDSAWKKYQAGKILQLIRTGRDYQAVIELNSIVEWQGFRTTSTAYLVGESWDGGMFWTFFDSQGDRRAAKQINPNLSDQLIIPAQNEKQEPIKNRK